MTRQRPYQCPFCEKSDDVWEMLVIHMCSRHGSRVYDYSDDGTPWPSGHCRCGKPFSGISELGDHLLRVGDLALHFAEARLKP